MKKHVKVYHLGDPRQEFDERQYWPKRSYQYKLSVLEQLRAAWVKMIPKRRVNGDFKRLRRVFRIIKQA
jgi:hypothetical protein